MKPTPQPKELLENIKLVIKKSKERVFQQINHTMVYVYYEIGRQIVESEQNGKERAGYAKETIKHLSEQLTEEFGRGFSMTNLEQMRKFYIAYSKPQLKGEENTLPDFRLSWSHYTFLMRIEPIEERNFYEIETRNNKWSLRELKRQFDSALYERLALSLDKEKVKQLSEKGQVIEKPSDSVKDPYIVEFLGYKPDSSYTEEDLETAIINKLGSFLLELGKGFTFVARQKRISFSEKHFHIDLVFYNRMLQCFVLIDLKIGELTHKDLGQMQMYVNYYDREMKLSHERKTIGIVLCRLKDNAVVEYTLPEDNQQIFASQYQTILPDKEKLKMLINGE